MNNLVAAYLSEVLGLSKRVDSKPFTSYYMIFAKFCGVFRKRGFFEIIGSGSVASRNTYKIIERGWDPID